MQVEQVALQRRCWTLIALASEPVPRIPALAVLALFFLSFAKHCANYNVLQKIKKFFERRRREKSYTEKVESAGVKPCLSENFCKHLSLPYIARKDKELQICLYS
jgi:hypothetical protein